MKLLNTKHLNTKYLTHIVCSIITLTILGTTKANNLPNTLKNYINNNSTHNFRSRGLCQRTLKNLKTHTTSGEEIDTKFTLIASGKVKHEEQKASFIKDLLAKAQEVDNRYFLGWSLFDSAAIVFLTTENFRDDPFYFVVIPLSQTNHDRRIFCFGEWR